MADKLKWLIVKTTSFTSILNANKGVKNMRYKTIADFGAYTVVEPTEPVKKIQTINICRKPVQMNRTQHKQISHKRRKKVEKELNHSAYMTTAVTFFSIVSMVTWWVAVGY